MGSFMMPHAIFTVSIEDTTQSHWGSNACGGVVTTTYVFGWGWQIMLKKQEAETARFCDVKCDSTTKIRSL
jgi:hypothetical protein